MKFFDAILEAYREEYELNLEEGLIKTTQIEEAIYILKKQFSNWIFEFEKGAKDFTIEILKSKGEINIADYEKLKTLLNNLGYFISYIELHAENFRVKDRYSDKIVSNAFQNTKTHSIYLKCEAKFDQRVNKIPNTLYHIAPLRNWEKIQKIGLVPKSRSKKAYHPERVYVGKNEKHTLELATKFYETTGIKDWALLKIDTDLIPGDYLRLYYDPNYKYGYYTMNNIPPQAIEKIKNVVV